MLQWSCYLKESHIIITDRIDISFKQSDTNKSTTKYQVASKDLVKHILVHQVEEKLAFRKWFFDHVCL